MLSSSSGQRYDRARIADICESILWALDQVLPQVALFRQQPRLQQLDIPRSLKDAKERMEKRSGKWRLRSELARDARCMKSKKVQRPFNG